MLLAWGVPLGVFIWKRNKEVEYGDRVLTKAHLRRWLAAKAVLLGLKVQAEAASVDEQGPPLKLKPMGAQDRARRQHQLADRQAESRLRAGPANDLRRDGARGRQPAVRLRRATVAVKHQIDGVWHNQQPVDRVQAGDPILAVYKTLSALNVNERRAKQSGLFGVEVKRPSDVKEIKYLCKITTQGTQAGERVALQLEGKKVGLQVARRSRACGKK